MEAVLQNALKDNKSIADEAFAAELDEPDAVAHMRTEFLFPATEDTAVIRKPGSDTIYLCGNSLGLQPRRTRAYVNEELDKWAEFGVEGHFKAARNPWVDEPAKPLLESMGRVVGAGSDEVVIMNSLTTNLHLFMVAFYRPTAHRFKIITEAKAFPSDTYAVKSQLLFHGYAPSAALVELQPREGEETLRTADIVAAIEREGTSVALVLLSGVQYYTGQLFEIDRITAAAHAVGAASGWDLAHAVGNVPLQLHDWNVDFAAWCSYKYLNSGPGGIAGGFVHSKFSSETIEERPHFAGWWGHSPATRFLMGPDFHAIPGAASFQLSNPPILPIATLRASLELFDAAGGMSALRAKSRALTAFLEALLTKDEELNARIKILTPADPNHRGCQLSLVFSQPVREVQKRLSKEGIVVDIREPSVIRVAPVPLYNTARDVLGFVRTLKQVLESIDHDHSASSSNGTGASA